jgi:hypothetical protein
MILLRMLVVTPLLLIASQPAFAVEPIVGRASVIDGDTVDIGKTRIRFEGIDAPESWQRCSKSSKPYRCGKEAADALDGFLAASRPLRCAPHYKEGHGPGSPIASAPTVRASMNGWSPTATRSIGRNIAAGNMPACRRRPKRVKSAYGKASSNSPAPCVIVGGSASRRAIELT